MAAFQNGVYTPNPYYYNPQPAPYTSPYLSPYAPQTPAVQTQVQQPVQQAQLAAQTTQSQQTSAPPQTNKIFVTGKEDALNRQAPFNSEIIYLHQDKPFGFQVYTDGQGKKTVTVFRLTECTDEELKEETTSVAKSDLSMYATKEDLTDGLAELESKIVQHIKQVLPKKKKVVVEDDED